MRTYYIRRKHKPFEPFHYAHCPNCSKLLRENGNGYFRCRKKKCGKEFVIYELIDNETDSENNLLILKMEGKE